MGVKSRRRGAMVTKMFGVRTSNNVERLMRACVYVCKVATRSGVRSVTGVLCLNGLMRTSVESAGAAIHSP